MVCECERKRNDYSIKTNKTPYSQLMNRARYIKYRRQNRSCSRNIIGLVIPNGLQNNDNCYWHTEDCWCCPGEDGVTECWGPC